jgi:hypothetical protein
MGQMALGAGTENTDLYKFGALHFAGIDNIHVVRDSINKMMEGLYLNLTNSSSNRTRPDTKESVG